MFGSRLFNGRRIIGALSSFCTLDIAHLFALAHFLKLLIDAFIHGILRTLQISPADLGLRDQSN